MTMLKLLPQATTVATVFLLCHHGFGSRISERNFLR